VVLFGFSSGTKGEKVVLLPLGFSTGTKSEKLNLYSSIILNSLLVTVLNSKSITFSPLLPVQRPQEIEEKNSKKVFIVFLYRSKYLIFGLKIFEKF
jgi:hypothetical protein